MFFQLREALEDLLYVRGVFHLDVKLENCLINPTSMVVKICDFGLGKVLTGSPDDSCFLGVMAGTPLYFSPKRLNEEYAIPCK